MASAFPLLALLFGCWPHLPGSWEDYVTETDSGLDSGFDSDFDSGFDTGFNDPDPGGVRVVGEVRNLRLSGDYWGPDHPDAARAPAWWAVLEQADPEFRAIGTQNPQGVGCVADPDANWLTQRLVTDGSGTSQIRFGGGRVNVLEWTADRSLYTGDIVSAPGQTFLSILPTSLSGDVWAVDPWVHMPYAVPFQGPGVNLDDIERVTPDQMVWTWSTFNPPAADYVRIVVTQLDGAGDSIEAISCVVDVYDAEIEIPVSLWTDRDAATTWRVELASLTERRRPIDEHPGEISVSWGVTSTQILLQPQ